MTGLLTALYQGKAVIDIAGNRIEGDDLAGAAGAVAHRVAGARRIAVTAHARAETLVAVAGVLAAGAAAIPIHPAAGAPERKHILSRAEVDLVLDDVDLTAREALPPEPPADERAAVVLFTSGSTGPPKGVTLSRRAVASNLDTIAALWEWHDADVLAHGLPFFHVHGLVFGGLGPLRLGSPLVHTGRYFRPVPGATIYFGVPTLWASLRDGDLAALRAARLLVSGAGALPQREFDRVERHAGHRILNRYAMTETLIITSPRLGDTRSPRSVGPPLPGVDVRLVEFDGALREVQVRGPGLFSGYLGGGGIDADGWFATGDLGEWAEDGSLRLLGRRDTDLIKTGGYRVGAGEVESALLEHPAVAEAAVAGLPDDTLGQRVTAWVVPSGPLEVPVLAAFLADLLVPYKRPLEIRLVESLPRNALGKVQKRLLTG